MSDAPIVDVQDVHYAYADQPALRGVSLTVRPGESVALLGRNGSGKTTLAKHLNGLLKPQRGRVIVGGLDTAQHDTGRLAAAVGYVFQSPDHQLFSPTVREELAFGPRCLGLPPAEIEDRVQTALAQFSLEPFAKTPPALLGFALRRLVAIASVSTLRPAVLVLDEPFAGLDWISALHVIERIHALTSERMAIVTITHQIRAVAECATRCVVLEAGQVLADRATPDVLTDRALLERTGLVPPPIVQLGAALRGFSGRATLASEFVDEYRRLRRTP
ncbi:MAG TPA: ABC transporter ATP-binding protein [Chloroflexota bacterium]|nr:ABC transporter ATP-binding protein [Chloroflexota bacterium]